jgi:hypothetical protein
MATAPKLAPAGPTVSRGSRAKEGPWSRRRDAPTTTKAGLRRPSRVDPRMADPRLKRSHSLGDCFVRQSAARAAAGGRARLRGRSRAPGTTPASASVVERSSDGCLPSPHFGRGERCVRFLRVRRRAARAVCVKDEGELRGQRRRSTSTTLCSCRLCRELRCHAGLPAVDRRSGVGRRSL